MANTIKIKRSSVADAVPAAVDLEIYELAMNIVDGRLFSKNNAGAIIELAPEETPTQVLTKIKTVDGAGSGLDSDLLDGLDSLQFLRSDVADTVAGALTFTAETQHNENIGASWGSNSEFRIAFTAGGSYLTSREHGGIVVIRGENALGTVENFVVGRPDDGVELWADGSLILKTALTGVNVTGDVDASGAIKFGANNWNLSQSTAATSLLKSAASNLFLEFQNSTSATIGYIHGDIDEFGLLDHDGNWAIRHLLDSHTDFYDNNEKMFSVGVGGVTGTYGTVEVKGVGKGGWDGYSINGQWVFMSQDDTRSGIMNDSDNAWAAQFYRGGKTELYFGGAAKFATTGTGVTVTGDVTATNFIGSADDAKLLDGLDSLQFLRSDVADVKTAGHLKFSDNVHASFGDDADFSIYWDGTNYKVKGYADGAPFWIEADNAAGLAKSLFHADPDGAATIYHKGVGHIQTTNTGIFVAGDITATDLHGSADDAKLLDGLDSTQFLRSDQSDTMTGDLTVTGTVDANALTFGSTNWTLAQTDTNRSALYGAGNSYNIVELRLDNGTKTGLLWAEANGNIFGLKTGNEEWMLRGVQDSYVSLYYDNAVKLQTSATGISVTGDVVATGDIDATHVGGVAAVDNMARKGDLGNAVDLNTFQETGIWQQQSNAQAASGTNYPYPQAGTLTVTNRATFTTQRYQVYTNSNTYERTHYNGTWYSWRRVARQEINGDLYVDQTLYAGANVDAAGAIKLGPSDHIFSELANNRINLQSGSTGGSGIRFMTSSSVALGSVYADTSYTGFLDTDSQWAMRHIHDSHTDFLDNNELMFSVGVGGVTGDYGTVQVKGSGKGGWQGYSIDGDAVYMSNGTYQGLYDDTNSQWGFRHYHGAQAELFYNGAKKLETNNGGATVTGNLIVNGPLDLPDNQALRLGDSDDFIAYHSGTATYFKSQNHGAYTYFQGEDTGGTNRAMLYMDPDGSVTAYYAGAAKFATVATGITVVGEVEGDTLSISGDAIIYGDLTVQGSTTAVNTADLDVEDNNITLNKGETGAGVSAGSAGIIIDRGTLADALILFDETSDKLTFSRDNGTTTYTILTTEDEGAGNGMDADTVDGLHAASFIRSDATDTATGALTFTGIVDLTNNANWFSGHMNWRAYDSSGNHYPHWRPGATSNKAIINHRVYKTATTYDVLRIAGGETDITWQGNKLWSAGNDGSGSGLDADTVDGIHAVSFLRSDIADTSVGKLTLSAGWVTGGTGDLNNVTALSEGSGMMFQTFGGTAINKPYSGNNANGVISMVTHSGPYGKQIAFGDNDDMYIRRFHTSGTMGTWRKLYHSGSTDINATTLDSLDSTQFLRSDASDTMTGNLTVTGSVSGTSFNAGAAQDRVKFEVWSSTVYGIGMKSSMTYGALNDYAMTFQMSGGNTRGWWWGFDTDTDAQGSMSLTKLGILTVKDAVNSASLTTTADVNVGADLHVDGWTYLNIAGANVVLESDLVERGVFDFRQNDVGKWLLRIEADADLNWESLGAYNMRIDGNRILTEADLGNLNDADTLDGLDSTKFLRSDIENVTGLFENITLDNALFSNGDTNTYMQFHAADQWRVVVGGAERLEVNTSGGQLTGTLTVTTALAGGAVDDLTWGHHHIHSTNTDFNTFLNTKKYGAHFVQNTTNGPGHTGATQYYHQRMGLGSDYINYSLQLAFPRNRTDAYIYYRNEENGLASAWYKYKAGDSDLLDGLDSTQFLRSDTDDTYTGNLTGGELVQGLHPTHAGYYGLWNTERFTANVQNYMIISAGDGTYINGAEVYLRPGANNSGDELRVATGTSGLTFRGGQVWHSQNDGAGSGLDADLLDGINSTSFLRSDTSDAFSSGTLTFNANTHLEMAGGLYFKPTSTTGFVPYPIGGQYAGGSSVTGALKIAFPTAVYAAADMMSMWVDIYDYATDEAFSLFIGGYIYQGEGANEWVNPTVINHTAQAARDFTVRFGAQGGRHCLWIGETTTNWGYPTVSVRDVQAAFSATISNWDDDWVISFETVLGTVDLTHASNLPQAKHATTAGDADTVDGYHAATASTVSTVAVRDSSGDINARLFKSEYDVTNGTVNYIMTQVDTATNNFIRPTLPSQFRTAVTDAYYLGISAKAADSELLDGINSTQFLRSDATDTATGDLTFTGANTHNGLNHQFPGHYYHGMYSTNDMYVMHYPRGGNGANYSRANYRFWNGAGSYRTLIISGAGGNITWDGRTVWDSGNDGAGSGLDADLLDGQHGSYYATAAHNHSGVYSPVAHDHDSDYLGISAKAADSNLLDGLDSTQFLRSDATDTMTGSLTVTGAITGASLDVSGTMTFGANNWILGQVNDDDAYLKSGDATVTSLALRASDNVTRGYFYATSSNLVGILDSDRNWAIKHTRDSHTDFLDNNETMFSVGVGGVTGDYGTVQVKGGGKGAWDGYSIEGAHVFMASGAACGLYNDTNNEWYLYATQNAAIDLRYNGLVKLVTTNTGVTVTGTVSATTFSGNATSATNADTVDGYHANASIVGNTVPVRNGSGYLYSNYFNMSANDIGGTTPTAVAVETSNDNFVRWDTWASFIGKIRTGTTALTGSSLDVSGTLAFGADNWSIGQQDINRSYLKSVSATYNILEFRDSGNVKQGSIWSEGTAFGLKSGSAEEWLVKTNDNGNVELYYDGVVRFATTSTGANLTGDLIVSGGDISLTGTGRIQGVDTVTADTDAASKGYVDTEVAAVTSNVPSHTKIVSFGSQNGHMGRRSMVLSEDGTLWSWGINDYGQLGTFGYTTAHATRDSPMQVRFQPGEKVVSFSASRHTSAAITEGVGGERYLWTWGYNANGQLGTGNTTSYGKPNYIDTSSWDGDPDEVFVICSYGTATVTFVITTTGKLYGCGYNTNGGLGIGNNTATITTFTQATGLVGSVTAVSGCGYTNYIVVGGTWQAAGYNQYGELGRNNTTQANTFANVQDSTGAAISGITKLECTSSSYITTGYCLTTANKLYTVGHNGDYQCGTGNTTAQTRAYNVANTVGDFQSTHGRYGSTMYVTTAGALYGFGRNYHGELGRGNTTQVTTPTALTKGGSAITGVDAIYGSGGCSNTPNFWYWRDEDGTDGQLWGAGMNAWRSLGVGWTSGVVNAFSSCYIPAKPLDMRGHYVWTGSNNIDHTVALLADGRLYSCGHSGQGQLGYGYGQGDTGMFNQVGFPA